MKPFIDRLKHYYSDLSAAMKGESDVARILANPSDLGGRREMLYGDFLRNHLPNRCSVVYGGFLFGQEGDESNQLDIIVTSEVSPSFQLSTDDGSKGFSCIDGTVGVVSIKSNLTKTKLFESLDEFASLPEKQPIHDRMMVPGLKVQHYDEFPLKVIFALKGPSQKSFQKNLNEYYDNHKVPLDKQPNVIHVLDQYWILRGKHSDGEQLSIRPSSPETIERRRLSDSNAKWTDIDAFQYVIHEMSQRATVMPLIDFDYWKVIEGTAKT